MQTGEIHSITAPTLSCAELCIINGKRQNQLSGAFKAIREKSAASSLFDNFLVDGQ